MQRQKLFYKLWPLLLLRNRHSFFELLEALFNDDCLQEVLDESLVCLAAHGEFVSKCLKHAVDLGLFKAIVELLGASAEGYLELQGKFADLEDLLVEVMRDASGQDHDEFVKEPEKASLGSSGSDREVLEDLSQELKHLKGR
jgi:hypothetical protein